MEKKDLPETDGEVSPAGSDDVDRPVTRKIIPWEGASPENVTIIIDVQCYQRELQTKHIRKPIHDVALALLSLGHLHAYEIAQALDTVSQFWGRLGSGDAELEDFETDFDGTERRQTKIAAKWLAHAIAILEPEDECPVCKCGTVELNDVGAMVCRGECGTTLIEAPEPEPDGSQQGGEDAEEERSEHDDRSSSCEKEDQGDE